MITISMFKRDQFGRKTNERVSHSAREGHSINAFFARGGRSHKDFQKLSAGQSVSVLKSMREEYNEQKSSG